MYYPKSQIITNLHTNGEEFAYSSTKQPYVGYYWTVYSGRFFTGKNPQDVPTQELVAINNEFLQNNTVKTSTTMFEMTDGLESFLDFNTNNYPKFKYENIPVPTFSSLSPTQQDYVNGEFKRYFCKKTNEIIYLEISKDTYDKLVKKDSSILWQLYQPFTLTWQLSGSKEQVFKVNKNTVELTSVKQKLLMLAEYLKMDFTKYYKYPEASNLYTKGNELKTVQDNKVYIGFYHIHPDKGYMAGATHVLEPHAYLSPINGFSYSGLSFKNTSKLSSNPPPSTGGGMSSGGGY